METCYNFKIHTPFLNFIFKKFNMCTHTQKISVNLIEDV